MNFKELKPCDQKVIALFGTICFGRLENLIVEDGVLKPTENSRQISTSSFDHEDVPRQTSRADGDFILKDQHRRFLDRVHHMENGFIKSITIRAGLPVSAEIEEAIASI